MKTLLSAFLFFRLLATSYSADAYEREIRNLAVGTPDVDIKASLHSLKAAGTAAFPTLIAHFSDRDPAEPRYFQRERVDRTPDGSLRLHLPTIGEACFDLLHGQIEGNWPKGFRDYYVLTPGNAKQWLGAHRELTINQLRRASRTESLRRAEADLAKAPSDAFLKETVTFLREELENTNR